MKTTPTWAEATELCRALARADMQSGPAVRPTVLGFAGDTFLGMVELRPHEKAEYEDPMVEALALLVPLGSDRLAHVASGRVWSLDDPIPPVADGVDLRQSTVVVTEVDHHGLEHPTTRSTLFPYDRLRSGLVVWDEPVTIDEEPVGPIPAMLRILLSHREESLQDDLTIGRQAVRLLRLGHSLSLPKLGDGDPRLASCLHAAMESERSGEPQPDWTLAQSWS